MGSSHFSPSQLLQDITKTANAIGAPYSEPATSAVLKTFEECFKEGAVTLRTTNRPGDQLNYRFYACRKVDMINLSTEAGFIEPGNHLARLVTSLSSLYNGEPEQWCDFDAERGLAKNWVHFKARRPVDEILNTPEVPEVVRAHGPTFHSLGLELVKFVAVDYSSNTMNLYFTAPGPVTETQAAQYAELAQSAPPTQEEFKEMREFLNPTGFAFAVTMEYATGKITRVAFYAMELPPNKLPTVNERVLKFFQEAPSHEEQNTRIVAWSYGTGNNKYMKAESGYSGGVAALLKGIVVPTTAQVAAQS